MDELRQRLDRQLNAYLNSPTPAARMLNKPPPKEDMDRMKELARAAPPRLNAIAQSIWERNRNWVNFVLVRYVEQLKCFDETGYRHRLYTPQMLGKAPLSTEAGAELTPAQQAQRRINRMLHGVKEGEAIPADAVKGDMAPMSATAPQQGGAPAPAAAAGGAPAAAAADGPRRVQRKVIIKRIIKKKADGTQEVVEQRTVVEVPIDGNAPVPAAAKPAAAATQVPAAVPARTPAVVSSPAPPRPAPKPAPAKPVDKELDDFFKKYNLK